MDLKDILNCTKVSQKWRDIIAFLIIQPKLKRRNRGLDHRFLDNDWSWDDANLIFSILENQEKLSKVHGQMMMKASGPVDWKMSFLPSKSIETQGQWMAMAKVYCYCDAISFN